ncbi:hypothetical protein ACMFMG_007979 [Clarireedia jacksonii]
MRFLVKNGADLNIIQSSPLPRQTVVHSHEEVLQAMLDSGIDVNNPVFHDAFCDAATNGQTFLRLGIDLSLRQNGPNSVPTGIQSLINVTLSRLVSTVEYLAGVGIPLNNNDKNNDAVYLAKLYHRRDICDVFVFNTGRKTSK